MDLTKFLSKEKYEIIDLEKKYGDKKHYIEAMFEVQEKVLKTDKKIRINATNCEEISPICLIILASTIVIAKEKELKITFLKNSKLMATLMVNGFISTNFKGEDTIPLNLFSTDEQAINIIEKLVDCSPLKRINADDIELLKSRLFELPTNAINHGMSEYKGAICHGYYTNKSEFVFSIYDLGIGIPKSVENYKKQELNSVKAIKWALEKGNSTSQVDYSRGVGFSLVEELVQNFNGEFIVISGDAMYKKDKEGKDKFEILNKKIKGTLITIKISI